MKLIEAGRLSDELDRLAAQYQGNRDALLVVDAVRCWLMEETVEDEELGPVNGPGNCFLMV